MSQQLILNLRNSRRLDFQMNGDIELFKCLMVEDRIGNIFYHIHSLKCNQQLILFHSNLDLTFACELPVIHTLMNIMR
jgi:hypothetical protein